MHSLVFGKTQELGFPELFVCMTATSLVLCSTNSCFSILELQSFCPQYNVAAILGLGFAALYDSLESYFLQKILCPFTQRSSNVLAAI